MVTSSLSVSTRISISGMVGRIDVTRLFKRLHKTATIVEIRNNPITTNIHMSSSIMSSSEEISIFISVVVSSASNVEPLKINKMKFHGYVSKNLFLSFSLLFFFNNYYFTFKFFLLFILTF